MAKSCSQPVNLPGAQPLMKPLSVCFSFAVRTIATDARRLGQAQCCLSVAKGNKNKELPFEEIAKGYMKGSVFVTPLKQPT